MRCSHGGTAQIGIGPFGYQIRRINTDPWRDKIDGVRIAIIRKTRGKSWFGIYIVMGGYRVDIRAIDVSG